MPITLNNSNISVKYSTGSNYIIEAVKSDLYRKNENIDNVINNVIKSNIQSAPVTSATHVDSSGNIYAVESYTYSGSANTTDYTRVFPKNTTCDILIVGGGGGGARRMGGGGGAGALIFYPNYTFTSGSYNIKIGKGGNGSSVAGNIDTVSNLENKRGKNGFDSEIILGTNVLFRAKGGGGGLGGNTSYANPSELTALDGGSGGGNGGKDNAHGGLLSTNNIVLSTNVPVLYNTYNRDALIPKYDSLFCYGNEGGIGGGDNPWYGSGGGGAGQRGRDVDTINTIATANDMVGLGGNGLCEVNISGTIYNFATIFGNNTSLIGGELSGSNIYYAGGGGGGSANYNDNTSPYYNSGGLGGGGRSGTKTVVPQSGIERTGGGGGGDGLDVYGGGNGGSGIVIIRYLLGTIPTTNFLTNEPTIIAPTFTETIRTFLHSGGAETQTTYNITVGQNTICDILIVGGGGGGGNGDGSSNEPGGGGAGGVVYMVNKTFTAGTYKINVGKGGASNTNGNNSTITDNNNNTITFDNILLIGKGGGKGATTSVQSGSDGGSGGGGGHNMANGGLATQGNTFWNGTTYVAGGYNGGTATAGGRGGGGGGASESGDTDGAGFGGDGIQVNISGVNTFYAGGGNAFPNRTTTRSDGGGGLVPVSGNPISGGDALENTGSGGSGAYGGSGSGGKGGSGIVVIKFKSITNSAISEGNPITTHKRLNFGYDLTKYTEYQAQLKTGVGGWRIVRYLPPNLGRWYQGDYINTSTFTIPIIGIPYNYTNEWAVPFGTFDEMFFGTFDMTYWLYCLKTSVLGSYSNSARPIIKSSSSSTPYSALWYNRGGTNPEDPWIRIIQEDNSSIVYGEYNNLDHSSLRNAYGGMCVLVRDSTTGTIISNPNTYTLNFAVPIIADINNNSNIILRGTYDISLSSTTSSIIPKENQYITPPTTFTNNSVERIYPPIRNFTAATSTISGQLYGNGTYTVSFSSTFGGGLDPWTCFNTSTGSGGHWADNRYTAGIFNSTSFIVSGYLGDWIKIQLPVAIKLTMFGFLMRTETQGLRDRSPRDFKIYGSNDNITWVELVNKTGTVYNASFAYEQRTPEITIAYSYYALVVNKLFGTGTVLNFDEWYIYGQELFTTPISLRYSVINPILDPIGAQWTYNSSNTNVYHFGNVSIGTTNPEYSLDVRGNIFSSTGGFTQSGLTTWTVLSDYRIKENIVKASYDKCLENVKNIELYNFNFKNNYVSTNDRHQLGFIAQEVQEVYPKAVEVGRMIFNLEEKIDDLLTLNTTQLDYTLYGAVKGLINKIENIKTKIEQIKFTSKYNVENSNIL